MTSTAVSLRAEPKCRLPFIHIAVLAGIIAAALVPASCGMNEESVEIADGNYSAPVLESFSVTGSSSL
nr:hypothetical protein [Treponemataceae bacterium]